MTGKATFAMVSSFPILSTRQVQMNLVENLANHHVSSVTGNNPSPL